MCKILGKEFHQYLPLVMPPVMKTASLKPEMALLDSIPLVMPPVMKAASLKPEVTLLDSKYIISHATCNESCLTETRSGFIPRI